MTTDVVTVQMVPIELGGEAALAARFELLQAARQLDFPYDPPISRTDAMRVIEHQFPGEEHQFWLVHAAGGDLVGAVSLHLPVLDNLENATVDLVVHPEHRRRGYGRAALDQVIEIARTRGRRRLVGEICVDGPELPSGVRGNSAFVAACGGKPALMDVRRRLDLSVTTRESIAALLATAADASPQYHLVPWADRVPDDLIDGVAALESRMVEDAPMGELEWEPEVHDAERWRATEATVRGRGRRGYGCASIHSDTGEVTGFTVGVVDGDVPEHAWQWTTIVLPAHRGHRLGLRLKTYALLELLRHEPQVRAMDTWNAEANHPMIAVNELMGYRALDTWAECQLDLG